MDAAKKDPIKRTFIGSEEQFIGFRKFLNAKAEQRKQEEVKRAMMKHRQSKLAQLRRRATVGVPHHQPKD